MPGGIVVRGRVFARRVVAATDVAAGLAHPQVDPLHAELQALLAAGDLRREIEMLDRVEMCAGRGRRFTIAGPFEMVREMSGSKIDREAITADGIEALRAEIAELEGPARTEMAARIKAARELGDLKENADYHIAKEDQAHLETKIKRLRERLRNAEVVEVDGAAADSFAFGRTAEVLDESTGKVNAWTLVGSTEANLAEGRLSAESPIGRALRDAKVDEKVAIETPKGVKTFVVQGLVD
jgi:transcription elongation factor GreA